MNSILLATDFSETAVLAGEIARDMARRTGDKLVLLFVSEPPAALIHQLATDARAFEQAMREQDRAQLHARAEQLRAQGVTVEERLESGDPPDVIASVAADAGARLIVLGSHGRSAVTRWLLGSVAQRTLLLADRPVLVARRGPAPIAIDAWVAGTRPLRVLFAVDRSPGSAAAAAWIRWLGEMGPVDVRLVHVYNPLHEVLRLGLRPAADKGSDVEPILERELREFMGEICGAGALAFGLHPSANRPGEVVARDAEVFRADLLVLGTHQRTRFARIWLGSTAELALRASKVPVVCVPAVNRAALEDTGMQDEVC